MVLYYWWSHIKSSMQTLDSVMKLPTSGRKSEMRCMTGLGSWGQGQVKRKTECPGESICERKLWVTARYRHICKREVCKSYIAFTRKRERISGFQETAGKHQVDQILCMLPKTYKFWEFLMHIFMTQICLKPLLCFHKILQILEVWKFTGDFWKFEVTDGALFFFCQNVSLNG